MGCVFLRLGPAGVSGGGGVGVAFFDCASFIDRGLNVQSSVSYLVGVLEEAREEEGGDVFGAALLDPSAMLRTGLVTAGEGEEGLAGLGDGGEEDAELGPSTTLRINSLSRPPPVLQRIEVAFGGTGAGAAAASAAGLRAFGTDNRRAHGDTSRVRVELRGERSKG